MIKLYLCLLKKTSAVDHYNGMLDGDKGNFCLGAYEYTCTTFK